MAAGKSRPPAAEQIALRAFVAVAFPLESQVTLFELSRGCCAPIARPVQARQTPSARHRERAQDGAARAVLPRARGNYTPDDAVHARGYTVFLNVGASGMIIDMLPKRGNPAAATRAIFDAERRKSWCRGSWYKTLRLWDAEARRGNAKAGRSPAAVQAYNRMFHECDGSVTASAERSQARACSLKRGTIASKSD
jgi:hypothetical protein